MTILPNARYVAGCKMIATLLFYAVSGNTASAADNTWRNYVEGAVVTESEWAIATTSGSSQKLEVVIEPELDINLPGDSVLTTIARLRVDAIDQISPDTQGDIELREFYLETKLRRTFLTIGKQQVVWGKADGLKVLDVVNPQDYREFILDDFDDSRIPLWTFNAEIPIEDVTLQLLWIPDQTYNKFADPDAAYAFTSPFIVPQPPSGVAVNIQPTETPQRFLADSDWGMRLSTFWLGWDLTVNYLYHYDDTPVLYRSIRSTPTGPLATLSPRYERTQLIGGTFSNAFGELTLRGELGYSLHRYVSTNNPQDNDGVVKTNEFSYVLGLDWFGVSDTLLSMQLFQSRLSENDPAMIRDKTDTTLTFLVQRQFMNDTLSADLLWLHNLNIDDGLVRPSLSYQWDDQIEFWLGTDVFYGNSRGVFGQFRKRTRFVSGFKFSY